jgi:hypothetical protein
MSDPAAAGSAVPHRPPRTLRALALDVLRRLYALLLIAVVLYLSYRAAHYLVSALILPTAPPAQIVDLPRRATEALRAPGAPAFAGVTAVEHPRAPLGHYHLVDTWFQPDRFNGCTQSGCHAPLPHGRNRTDRAFLNMHATSLHCGVCHLQSDSVPLPLAWYDLRTGDLTAPPALLAAYAWLTAATDRAPPEYTAAEQAEIARLLGAAVAQAGVDLGLSGLIRHLTAVRPDSEVFPRLIAHALEVVPRKFRGEYGAKLALLDAAGRPRLQHPDSAAAIREYLARRETASDDQRQALLARVHTARRPATLQCTDCHTPTDSIVDLARVGYPPARIQQLVQPLIMRAIEHMRAGREFQMPTMLPASSGGAQPTTQPHQP